MKVHVQKISIYITVFVLTTMILISHGYTRNKITNKKTHPLIPSTHNSMVANVWTKLSNFGLIGDDAFNDPSFEWPGGSGNHYLYQGSIWIAGRDPSNTIHCTAPDEDEIALITDPNDIVHLYNLGNPLFQNRPNVHPSLADSQVSAEDTYAEYTDLDAGRHNFGESPLGIKIIERTYKWTNFKYFNFIIFDFQIINIGLDTDGDFSTGEIPQPLSDVYIGIRFDADVSFLAGGEYWYDDLVDYDTLTQSSFIYDGDDPDRPGDDTGENGLSTGYIYARLLYASGGTPFTTFANPISHTWWTIDDDPRNDTLKFNYMSIPEYKSLSDSAYDYRFLQSVGPFDMEPNDSVNVVWACGVNNGIDSIRIESEWAKAIYNNMYIVTDPTGFTKSDKKNPVNQFVLNQNYPNPFNPMTTFEFSIPKAEHVTLKIYDVLGKEVSTLISDNLKSGSHIYSWNASTIASGLYYYQIKVGEYTDIKKLILLK